MLGGSKKKGRGAGDEISFFFRKKEKSHGRRRLRRNQKGQQEKNRINSLPPFLSLCCTGKQQKNPDISICMISVYIGREGGEEEERGAAVIN